MAKTYYEILEISPHASKEEIKTSYRKLVRKFHPDVNKSPEAEVIFKKVNEAIEILCDDIKRLQYDHSINLAPRAQKTAHSQSSSKAQAQYQKHTKGQKKTTFQANAENNTQKSSVKADFKRSGANNNQNNNHNVNFSEIFHHFFEDKIDNNTKVKKINGEDIRMNLEISSKEAIEGAVKKVNIVHSEQCPKCAGRRFINGAKCVSCDGAGDKVIHKKVTITIQRNQKNGSVIKIPKEGKPGKFGGKNGDLILTLKIKQAAVFKIENGVAKLEVPITPAEALLGDSIKIPTLGGTTVMKIPPQTNSGQKFRILNAGIMNPKTGVRDDLIVVVKIDVPQKPTLEELKLYRELKNLDKSDVRKELFT